jgi:flagellar hook-associated protein 2
MGMALSGLASGFDWKSIVDQLIEVSRAPQTRMRREQTTNSQKSSALEDVRGKLAALKTSIANLNSQDSLLKKSATIADKNSNWTATATKDTPAGDYNVEMISQATASVLKGASGLGASINLANPISSTWMGATLTPGNFSLNGNTITISSTTTWSQLISQINALPSGPYSANIVNDKFVISGPGTINLGSDASAPTNFLQLARLFNNGTSTVSTDSGGVGKLRLDVPLNSTAANFLTMSSWASQGPGSIKVNGQAINITNGMTGQEVLDAITSSSAGVTASYDFVNNSISLRNKNLGNSSIDVQDVSGSYANLLKITSASNPTLINGQNTSFRVNGGGIIQSQGNTITENEHGIKGLVITANSLSAAGSSSVASTSASSLFLDASGNPPATPSATNYHFLRFPLNTSGISVGQVVTGSGIPNGTSVVSASNWNGYYSVNLSSVSGSAIPSGTPITFTNSYTPTKITVAGDTSAAKDALNDFVSKYNSVQDTIERYTKVTTSGSKVTSSILSGNRELSDIARKLRTELYTSSGLTGTVNRLSDLGVTSSGIQNTVSFNSSVLEAKLASASDDVNAFFKDAGTSAFMTRIKTNFLDKMITDAGSATGGLQAQLTSFTKQNTNLDKQIEEVERRLASQRSTLEASFIAMEKAQSRFQQQGSYLAKTFANQN